ncbi:hypothetical protein AMAG_04945 [Allomyces macrogynus ATCC 38327]|uniref:dihydrolipoyllysine-residue succinyltransferase n=1 Tax=Allomyces macrogynus (strain ATCC 38327) TaxID=578462 RepID=A0A0L0S6A8_ALLM3|nr:hypothetical protein AMAG_04945 [Allomyces macrogynus ATCC 38327]|eukprot:KNE58128.1 hypothetical protein AMAG_04945 [Allomyces macrogynus ATCC 38327]
MFAARIAARPTLRLAAASAVRAAAPRAVAAVAIAPAMARLVSAGALKTLTAVQARSYADVVTVKVPQMADSISEGTLKTWHKKVGDFVKADEEVATIETDKIDVAVNAPASGVIVEQFANEEDTVVVAADLFKLEKKDASEAPAAAAPAPAAPKAEAAPVAAPAPVAAAPAPAAAAPAPAAKPAAAPAAAPAPAAPAPAAPAAAVQAAVTSARTEERVKMSRMRLRIAERLKESQNTAASLTTFNEIDMSNIMEFRNKYKDAALKEHGVKLGFMSAFVKATTYAMKHVPVVNARIDGDHTVYPSFVDISVAVATPKGLVTPVLRDCQNMSFLDVERALADMAAKARDNKISIEDMAGGTFTISNGGVFGSMFGTPIINMPQSAILGMHAVKERAVVVNGKIEIRPVMYVCLTYDHRLIDGREATTFLMKLKEAIEDPRRMLL